MTKNLKVIDAKPSNLKVIDVKPNNKLVVDAKPKNKNINIDLGTEQYYTVVLSKGQYMGIPPFTYAEAGTIQSSFSP